MVDLEIDALCCDAPDDDHSSVAVLSKCVMARKRTYVRTTYMITSSEFGLGSADGTLHVEYPVSTALASLSSRQRACDRLTMMMLSRTALTRTSRHLASCRSSSSAAPKMHKAKGNWEALKSKRPIDADDTHVRKIPGWYVRC